MDIKNAEFDADFEPVKKLQKTHAKKCCVQKFSVYNFFRWNFHIFSTDSNSASNLAFYTHIEFLQKKLSLVNMKYKYVELVFMS